MKEAMKKLQRLFAVKKLKKVAAGVMAAAMIIGLFQAVPAGIFMMSAKAETVGDKTWDFKAATEAVTIQGSTSDWNGLTVDATSGKLAVRVGNWAQFNTGTILKVPVDGKCKITVVNYDTNYTIDGIAATDKTTVYEYKGDAGFVNVVATGNSYIGSIQTEHIIAPTLDTSKIDVWDFGGEALEGSYNNNINYDFINSCYPGVEPGTTGKCIESFTAKDGAGEDAFKFVTNKTNNRWRMTPAAGATVTHYDDKTKVAADGTVFAGFLYSNSAKATPTTVDPASTNIVQTEFYLYKGDILTCWLGSNGTAAHYVLVDADGNEISTFDYSAVNQIEEAKFYAAEDGWYTLYCATEKLVLARALREHTPVVTVSGNVTAPAELSGYSVTFTNTLSGAVTNAKVADGKYSAKLNGKYTYDITLKDANGYVIDSAANVTVEEADKTFDVSVKAVDLITVTGTITGLNTDALAKVSFDFNNSSAIYIPEITVDKSTGSYTLKAEKNVTYSVVANNVNDYELNTTEVAFLDNTSGYEIAFTAKPVHEANVFFTGLSGADTSAAKVIFTNIDEKDYTYTFGINDKAELRNGQYSVKVTGLGQYPYVQGVTPDVKIDNAAGRTVAPFSKINDWNIASIAAGNTIDTVDGVKYFAGLKLNGTVSLNKNMYLLTSADATGANPTTVTIPGVKAGDVITLKYCYCASFKVGDIVVDEKSGSTSQIDSVSYTATQDGDLVIEAPVGTNSSQTYFTEINVSAAADKVAYKETVTVGTDKDYKTISAAIDAVGNMERTAEQNVTIMIDPGNYEEMLVIDVPNITLKNASENASIELKNKGVDIDDNAVRVTWYYGHGYTYYSMGNDCKYDEDLMIANQLNGYPTFVNPGSGTTNGSYWNATVVINADNVSADGIIFENSFNQYVSEASAKDTIVSQSSAKNGSVLRDDMKTVGDTTVQDKAYVERAACLSIYNDTKNLLFNNCKFIGRQDTLYGGVGVTAAFDRCSVYGGTDYIFGGMTAVFKKCDLVFNTSENNNDVGYITAPQQSSGRGYLMYKCNVTSTVPGVDTASEYTSKPGYLGRPWQANTGEAVFYKTTIDAADEKWSSSGTSLILPAGWLSTLSGESALCGEYGTIEKSGVDNSAGRASWSAVFTDEKLADGSDISIKTFLGEWEAFAAPADTKELTEKLASAEKFAADAAKYTESTVKVLTDAIAEVKAADVTDLSEQEVTSLIEKLNTAIDGLEKKPTEPEEPTEPDDVVKVEGDKKDVVSKVVIEESAVIKDNSGNVVSAGDVKFNISSVSEEMKSKLEKLMNESGITVPSGSVVEFYDIKLSAADGSVVKLESGKVRITIKPNANVDMSKTDVKIYYMKDDGTLEEIKSVVNADGTVYMDVDTFSPYIVSYQPKAETEDSTAEDITSGDEDVKTGDTMNWLFFIMLVVLSGAFCLYEAEQIKKRKSNRA